MKPEIQQIFYQLYHDWKNKTRFSSILNDEQEIIDKIELLGKDIIPLLVANLYDSWLPILLLPKLTGITSQIKKSDWGNFDIVSAWWVNWYNANR